MAICLVSQYIIASRLLSMFVASDGPMRFLPSEICAELRKTGVDETSGRQTEKHYPI
jgi:hypothetical protein